jgi:hypothetical protein
MKKNPISRLTVFIGGYMGNSYKVELKNNVLVYEVLSYGYKPKSIEEIQPSDAQWKKFINDLKILNVSKWKSEYRDPSICDGTGWSAKAAFDGRITSSSGSNAYPDNFESFLEAVSSLIGGRKFE